MIAAGCIVPLLAACYTYAPIEPAAARPGAGVRARITPQAATRLAPLLGTGETRVLTGKVIESGASAMIIEVPAVVDVGVGSSMQSLFQRVSLSRADVVELETRKLDRMRTGALAVGGAIVVGAAVVKSLSGGPGKEQAPGGGGTDTRIPIRDY
jgi:hypothetical protein